MTGSVENLEQPPKSISWRESLSLFLEKKVLVMLLLGFSAGIPYLLIFSSLSLWLGEAGVEKSTVTYFSWAILAYSFKFLWSPLIDQLPIPILTNYLGRRRSWMLFSQFLIILAIVIIGSIDPSINDQLLTYMAIAVVMLGVVSATQDTVIDAYRIECATEELQAIMASSYIAGYRVGMITSGAGALVLADLFGSSVEQYNYLAWQQTYYLMACLMLVGVVTTWFISEPVTSLIKTSQYSARQYLKFLLLFIISGITFIAAYRLISKSVEKTKADVADLLSNTALSSFIFEFTTLAGCLLCVIFVMWITSKTPIYEKELVKETYIRPISEFFQRYGVKIAFLILIFIGFYRISDIVLGVIAHVFYQDMGFSKTEIAGASKTFGLGMTILGGFLGGLLSAKFGVMRIPLLGAVVTILTNLLFVLLAQAGHNLTLLYIVISADNISGGLASAAFVAYLASLTNVSFTAVQYAIFSSLMTLIPKTIGGYSGSMVETIGYENFFLLASAMGLPVLVIIYFVRKHTE